ncbi:AAA family ATPase [Phycicoccus sp. Soil803]|uniref:AAA family ATPase n=1 Tax=Phycicoccus sp. Soil803 TaxID=1736415 RepID=UPI00138ED426|nr:AAA family ATPase [Phycicoccus sp. Soil803]
MSASGFRGFPQPVTFDLDADAIVVCGVNGSGKTTFFDAILWALLGRLDRLGDDPSTVVSRYSDTGGARVEVVVEDEQGQRVSITRRRDEKTYVSVQRGNDEPQTGGAAELAIIELLWPDAQSAADPMVALSRSLTRATYLQQDSVREFIDADDEQARFQVVGELVGVGRIAELQRQLEAGRNAWTRATTSLEKELEPLHAQQNAIGARLRRLESPEGAFDEPQLTVWLRDVQAVLGPAAAQVWTSRDRDLVKIERGIAALSALEQTLNRRLALFKQLRELLDSRPDAAPDVSKLEAELQLAEERRNGLAARLSDAQQAAATQRRLDVALREKSESLRAMARLALEHLDDRCPVCGQAYERDRTATRLRRLIDSESVESNDDGQLPGVSDIARDLESAERWASDVEARLRAGRGAAARMSDWEAQRISLIDDLGLDQSLARDEVLSGQARAGDSAARAKQLRSEGERLTLQVARATEALQRQELAEQLSAVTHSIEQAEARIESRQRTGDLVGQIINALRSANDELVTQQLREIEPLLQRIFATVDPHPTFRAVNFLTRTVRGRGRLWTTLGDSTGGVHVQEPATVLSSSQLNVLAVSVFLALNLSIPTLPLQVVALDDPLQSLDNVNLLGLTDLLRRIRGTRQVIVSTHDDRLAGLLARKLRPISPESRTIRIDLKGWTSHGPALEISEIPRDARALRLIASA